MRVISTVDEFRRSLDSARARPGVVGLVPTMGALHEGHLSLVRRARADCDVVAVSVFVNPLQFGAGEDLDRYPRRLDDDAALAAGAGADVVFAPPVGEMYPGEMLTRVRVERVSEGMEGSSRPGHFEGVATVVTKLFAIAGACRAYFGEKDWQQLQVVRRLVADLSLPVKVVACPVVRAADGLALSSRNERLSPEEREAATVLHRALVAGARFAEAAVARSGEPDAGETVAAMESVIADQAGVRLDYAALVPDAGGWRLLIAAWVGGTRLIDNVAVAGPGGASGASRAPGR